MLAEEIHYDRICQTRIPANGKMKIGTRKVENAVHIPGKKAGFFLLGGMRENTSPVSRALGS